MASFTVSCPKSSLLAGFRSSSHNSSRNQPNTQKVSFGFQQPTREQLTAWKKITQVGAEKSANSAVVVEAKPDAAIKKSNGSLETPTSAVPDASTISAFMTQVSDLIKLVDSRDISELQLKQLDCELTIRKKEALQQNPAAASMMTMPTPLPHAMLPPQAAPAPAPAAALALPPASAAPSPAPAKPAGSSHPPLKCPMAGTLYRSPAPGEPPFVKVGDKVQKGQVVCIIEAMKLMNEIEADQSGTIAEILVDDGKPVSVDTPLFVIVP